MVTQGHRQPGSSFKAFVYTAAIDSDGWSPYQYIDASTHTYDTGAAQPYTPHNDDNARYWGGVSMMRAFASSITRQPSTRSRRSGRAR